MCKRVCVETLDHAEQENNPMNELSSPLLFKAVHEATIVACYTKKRKLRVKLQRRGREGMPINYRVKTPSTYLT